MAEVAKSPDAEMQNLPQESSNSVVELSSQPENKLCLPSKTPRKVYQRNADGWVELPDREFALIFFSILMSVFVAGLDNTIVVTALPQIGKDLGNIEKATWIIVSFLLTATATQPLYGKFSDLFGRRRVLLFAIGIFIIGSFLCAISPDLVSLIIFRAIQGIGGGGIFGLMFVLIGDISPVSKRTQYVGGVAGTFALSSVAGPLIGGAFTDGLSWRWAFWINLPIAGLAFVLLFLFLHLPVEPLDQKIDFMGIALIVGGVICICLATTWGGSEYPWDSATVVGLLEASVFFLILFIIWESKYASSPVIPMRLFRVWNVSISSWSAFFLGFCIMPVFTYLPIFFEQPQGLSATAAGVRMLPVMLLFPFAAGFSGGMVTKYKKYKEWTILGGVMLTVGMFLFSLYRPDSTASTECAIMIIPSLGMGFIIQVLIVSAQNAAPISDMAVVSTIVNFFQSLGSVIGTAIFQSIISNKLADSFAKIFAGLPNTGSGGTLVIETLPEPYKTQVKDAWADAINLAFLVAIPFGFLCLCGCIAMQPLPLKDTVTAPPAEEKAASQEAVDNSVVSVEIEEKKHEEAASESEKSSPESLPSVPVASS